MQLSDNVTHVIAAFFILTTGTLLIIFAHQYVDSAYVFGTCFTLVGALLGYNFGSNNTTVVTPVQVSPDTGVTQKIQKVN